MYKAIGNKVIHEHRSGEVSDVAVCSQAQAAADLMNRAGYLNDVKRQYTASARLFYKAECLPGFEWIQSHD